MSNEKLCQKFLRASADQVRKRGLARGILQNGIGEVCMLGAMNACGVTANLEERIKIEKHLSKVIVPKIPPIGIYDEYNKCEVWRDSRPNYIIAAWSNMLAKDAEEVARVFEKAAEDC